MPTETEFVRDTDHSLLRKHHRYRSSHGRIFVSYSFQNGEFLDRPVFYYIDISVKYTVVQRDVFPQRPFGGPGYDLRFKLDPDLGSWFYLPQAYPVPKVQLESVLGFEPPNELSVVLGRDFIQLYESLFFKRTKKGTLVVSNSCTRPSFMPYAMVDRVPMVFHAAGHMNDEPINGTSGGYAAYLNACTIWNAWRPFVTGGRFDDESVLLSLLAIQLAMRTALQMMLSTNDRREVLIVTDCDKAHEIVAVVAKLTCADIKRSDFVWGGPHIQYKDLLTDLLHTRLQIAYTHDPYGYREKYCATFWPRRVTFDDPWRPQDAIHAKTLARLGADSFSFTQETVENNKTHYIGYDISSKSSFYSPKNSVNKALKDILVLYHRMPLIDAVKLKGRPDIYLSNDEEEAKPSDSPLPYTPLSPTFPRSPVGDFAGKQTRDTATDNLFMDLGLSIGRALEYAVSRLEKRQNGDVQAMNTAEVNYKQPTFKKPCKTAKHSTKIGKDSTANITIDSEQALLDPFRRKKAERISESERLERERMLKDTRREAARYGVQQVRKKAKSILENAEKSKKKMLDDAKNEAAKTLSDAQDLLQTSQSQVLTLLTAAEKQADFIVKKAERRSERLSKGSEKAGLILKDTEKKRVEILTLANKLRDKIIEEANGEKKKIIKHVESVERKLIVEQEKTKWESLGREIIKDAKQEKATIISEANKIKNHTIEYAKTVKKGLIEEASKLAEEMKREIIVEANIEREIILQIAMEKSAHLSNGRHRLSKKATGSIGTQTSGGATDANRDIINDAMREKEIILRNANRLKDKILEKAKRDVECLVTHAENLKKSIIQCAHEERLHILNKVKTQISDASKDTRRSNDHSLGKKVGSHRQNRTTGTIDDSTQTLIGRVGKMKGIQAAIDHLEASEVDSQMKEAAKRRINILGVSEDLKGGEYASDLKANEDKDSIGRGTNEGFEVAGNSTGSILEDRGTNPPETRGTSLPGKTLIESKHSDTRCAEIAQDNHTMNVSRPEVGLWKNPKTKLQVEKKEPEKSSNGNKDNSNRMATTAKNSMEQEGSENNRGQGSNGNSKPTLRNNKTNPTKKLKELVNTNRSVSNSSESGKSITTEGVHIEADDGSGLVFLAKRDAMMKLRKVS